MLDVSKVGGDLSPAYLANEYVTGRRYAIWVGDLRNRIEVCDVANSHGKRDNMQYKVAEAYTAEDLENDVNGLIADGWAVQGGVSVCSLSYDDGKGWTPELRSYFVFAQAMVLRHPGRFARTR